MKSIASWAYGWRGEAGRVQQGPKNKSVPFFSFFSLFL
jgi:hypothetical protein